MSQLILKLPDDLITPFILVFSFSLLYYISHIIKILYLCIAVLRNSSKPNLAVWVLALLLPDKVPNRASDSRRPHLSKNRVVVSLHPHLVQEVAFRATEVPCLRHNCSNSNNQGHLE